MSIGDDGIEAQRIAIQHQSALAKIHERELERAREQGRTEAQNEQFKETTIRHFAIINGSIERTVNQLAEVVERLSRIEGTMSTHDAVDTAIDRAASNSGNRRFSRIQATGVLILASAAVGAFILSLISVAHG